MLVQHLSSFRAAVMKPKAANPTVQDMNEITRLAAELGNAMNRVGYDPAALDSMLRQMQDADSIVWVDMREVLRLPPDDIVPDIGYVQNGMPLLYTQSTNMLFGADGVGKSLIALKWALQQLDYDNSVMWIDFEEQTHRTMRSRMQDFGITPDDSFVDNFYYTNVEGRLSQKRMDELIDIAHGCTFVVLDSVGEYMSGAGANENYDDEVARWLHGHFARPLAAAGPAVLMIDHTTKASDGTSSAGSKRKRAGLTGASYHVSIESPEDAWSKETGGFAVITTAKDRHGHHQRGMTAAYVECLPRTDFNSMDIVLTKNRPTLMFVEDDEPAPVSNADELTTIEAFVRQPGLETFSVGDVEKFLRKNNLKSTTVMVVSKLDELAKQGAVVKVSSYAYAMPNLFVVDSED